MRWKTFKLYLLPMLLTTSITIADTFVHDDLITDPVPSHFNICHGGTCSNIAYASLNEHQWEKIQTILLSAKNAREERDSIRAAIALLEKLIGQLTNTHNDKAENLPDKDNNHYMDCIDESTNTSLYLTMMNNAGLLRWHSIEDRQTRGHFITGWPHTTAVIRETRSGDRYAVDSWFLDNGKPPFIIPLKKWHKGWRPGDR